MSDTAPQQPTYIIPAPSRPNWKTPLLVGVLVLLAATNIFLLVQMDRLRADSRNDIARMRDDMNATVDKIRVDSSEAVQRSRRSVESCSGISS